MTYEKPCVALIAFAVETIKSNSKLATEPFDGSGYPTEAAYEADE